MTAEPNVRRLSAHSTKVALEVDSAECSREAQKMTLSQATLIGLIDRYLSGLLDPFITVLEVHKLMYFMQVAGQPLKLKFAKTPYGPYAENLHHVLHAVEGHFISGYADGGDAPDRVLELVPGAVHDATAVLSQSHMAKRRFDRVADLVEGFESAFGLELLSTVHWVLEHENPATRDDLIALTHGWNERKKRFSPRQIQLAANVLVEKNWFPGVDEAQVQGVLEHEAKLLRNA